MVVDENGGHALISHVIIFDLHEPFRCHSSAEFRAKSVLRFAPSLHIQSRMAHFEIHSDQMISVDLQPGSSSENICTGVRCSCSHNERFVRGYIV